MFQKPMDLTNGNHLHVTTLELLLELVGVPVDDVCILAGGAELPAPHMRLEVRRITQLNGGGVLPRGLCAHGLHDGDGCVAM